ncbi:MULTISPECIES: hypothetical protein [unclassified Enterococcus]|uniref:sunset domain-containing protein n=1 Tax=unclassified Enterococcus TaxID=2608891 RepID=UPI00259B0F56|nr:MULTISPECIES: hypothetical protein [unclassified Enterococcus]MDO0919850.1 hypothetical protein [Enterococcus sp. B1E2]WIV14348.1 hypothetical protein QN079_10175 [Enterococcus sp. FZMF]
MKKVSVLLVFLLSFVVFPVTVFAASSPSVSYQTNVQSQGWQSWKTNAQTSGTTGKGKRLEAIKIKITNEKYKGSIEYKTSIQKQGWEKSFRKNGALSGTSGKGQRLEAIQIKLTGEIAKYYDVYYRVNAQQFGWMGWAKNGQSSGTSGFGFQLEAIQIKLVKKGGKAPGTTNNGFRDGRKKYVDKRGKGLIKGSKQKIYHLPGSQYYKKTTSPIRMFKTEMEAYKAGFRPAK